METFRILLKKYKFFKLKGGQLLGIWLKFVSKTNGGCKREASHSQLICNKDYI